MFFFFSFSDTLSSLSKSGGDLLYIPRSIPRCSSIGHAEGDADVLHGFLSRIMRGTPVLRRPARWADEVVARPINRLNDGNDGCSASYIYIRASIIDYRCCSGKAVAVRWLPRRERREHDNAFIALGLVSPPPRNYLRPVSNLSEIIDRERSAIWSIYFELLSYFLRKTTRLFEKSSCVSGPGVESPSVKNYNLII